MFNRLILKDLSSWAKSSARKPLILRGARQVGKTSVVRALGESDFDQLVELNLERSQSKANF